MPDGRYIAEKDYADFQRLMDEFRAVGRTLRKPIRRATARPARGFGLRAAIANGVIAAGVEGNIYFADASFAEDTAKPDTAWNDSGVPIPDGTKLYVGRVAPLSGLRIIQAFVCT